MQILHRGIFMPAFDRILQLARMEEMDCEFVEVTAHEGARPTHAVWQGRVYHRGGAVVQDGERYEDFETATGYGTGPGLCGWNCRHNFYPFYPGISVRNYTDERLAELDARSGACRTGRLRRGGPHGERHQEPKPGRVSRLVKRAGADTTLKNAVRDGAEWAWVPHGDTCPFCITLASNGWQKASSKVLKGGHADHIHANCDCEFAIRFDHSTTLAGYDPEKYLKQYRDAGGDINKMRRIDYAARKDAINAQKRAAYAVRKVNKSERSYSGGVGSNKADLDYMNSAPYRAKFDSVSDNPALNQSIYKYCKAAVTHQSGDYYEDLSILRMDGSLVGQTSSKVRNETQYSRTLNAAVKSAEPYSLVSLHNHGTNVPPSGADFGSAGEKKYAFGIVACHDGTIYKYSTRNARPFAVSVIDKKVDIYMAPPYNMGVINAFQRALQDAQEAYGIEWSEIK